MISATMLNQEQSTGTPFAPEPPLCAYCQMSGVLVEATSAQHWREEGEEKLRSTPTCERHEVYVQNVVDVVAVTRWRR